MNETNLLETTQLSEMRLKILGNIEDTSKDEYFKLYLKDAKYIALGTLYPFDLNINELPKRIEENWVVRCAIELYSNLGVEGYKKYAENGLSWEKESEYVSSTLMNELTPKADVPR